MAEPAAQLDDDRVEDDGPYVLSASQVGTAQDCLRKWAFKYIEHLPDPGNASSERGKRVHKLLERWLLEGQIPSLESQGVWPEDLDEDTRAHEVAIATAALGKLPPPKSPGMSVEGKIRLNVFGVDFRGYKDLEYWTDGKLVVHDHKTTSNFKYAKTHEELRSDTQAQLYAYHAFQKYPELSELELCWLYISTDKQPRTKPVRLTVYRDAVEAEARKLGGMGQKLVYLKDTVTEANTLPPAEDPATCEKFRGCPYKEQCGLSPLERVRAQFRFQNYKQNPHAGKKETGIMGMSIEDIRARFAAQQANKGAPAPVAEAVKIVSAVVDAPAPAPPPQTAAVQSIREKLAAPPPSPGHSGVVPPQTVTVHVPTETQSQVTALKGIADALEEVTEISINGITSTVAELAATEVKMPRKAGPGRPKKVDVREVFANPFTYEHEAVQVTAYVKQQDSAFVAVPLEMNMLKATAPNAFTLFVNCTPVKGGSFRPILLSEFLAPVHAALQAQLNVPHYKAVDYGKGVAALIDAVRQTLEQSPLGADVALIVDARTPEGSDCLSTLEQFAGTVVRGF